MVNLLYTAIDTETTGFPWAGGRMIEVAAIRYHINHPEPIAIYQSLVKGQITTDKIVSINHITQEMIDMGRDLRQVLDELIGFIGESPIVAHNMDFDWQVLNEEAKAINVRLPDFEKHCTLEMSRGSQHFRYCPNHKLVTLADDLKIDTSGAHRALKDADNCRRVHQKMKGDIS